MGFLLMFPAILSFLILAAHYFRDAYGSGNVFLYFLVVASAISPLLLLIRERLVLRGVQVLLVLGSWVFMSKGMEIVRERMQEQLPFRGALVIMTGVAVFALLAAVMLEVPVVKKRYRAWGG